MYLRLIEGQPETYSIGQMKRDNPTTSFPDKPSDELLAGWGVYPYTMLEPPAYDRLTQTVVRTAITEINGAWVQSWTVSDMAAEDAARNVRDQRDRLLQETDWIVIKSYERGQNIPAEWELYRQALRDITEQAGFPYEVTWPTKP